VRHYIKMNTSFINEGPPLRVTRCNLVCNFHPGPLLSFFALFSVPYPHLAYVELLINVIRLIADCESFALLRLSAGSLSH